MPRSAPQDGLNKYQRYRAKHKASGMKLVRIWTLDPHAPGFAQEQRRQAALLGGAPEELDALDFIAAATADLEAHDASLRAKAQEAPADTCPAVPHRQVMDEVQERIYRKGRDRSGA